MFISQVFPGARAKPAPNYHQSGMRVLQWNIFSTFALLGDFDCLRMKKEVDSKRWRYLLNVRFESILKK